MTAIARYLGIDLENASADDLYLVDMYRVAGQQGSVDYAEDKWEQNHVVGEVPYSCLWTARGELVDGDDPRTEARRIELHALVQGRAADLRSA